MAEQKLSTIFSESLLTLVDWAWPRLEPKIDAAFEFLSEAVRPDPPMCIRTLDGESVTGLLVVERGRVLVFIGTRSHVVSSSPHPNERFAEEPLGPRGEPYSPR